MRRELLHYVHLLKPSFMKNLLLICLGCFLSLFTNAQTVTNNTNCDLWVTAFCYTIADCRVSQTCNRITVSPSTTVSLPADCPCPLDERKGYIVSYASSNCAGSGVSVVKPGSTLCGSYNYAAVLPQCGNCKGSGVGGTANVFFSGSNLIVQ